MKKAGKLFLSGAWIGAARSSVWNAKVIIVSLFFIPIYLAEMKNTLFI